MLSNAFIATTDPTPPPVLCGQLSPEQDHVLSLLRQHTYDQVSQRTGWSRGKIYSLAIRTGARKNETRIKERHEERRRRQVEFLNEVINSTVKSDVLDFLDGLPTNGVQMHLTSCPYNMGKAYGGTDCPSADRMRFTYFHGFLMQVISEMARTLAPGGTLFLNLGSTRDPQENLLPLDILLFENLKTAGLTFQSRIIWVIPHGLTPKRRLAERHETILVFSKGEQQTFNPSAARIPQKEPQKRAFKGPNKGQLSGHPLGAHPTNVWNIPNVGHNHSDRRFMKEKHPAPFPLALAKRGVLLYTMPGDLVCDAFSGSGTTNLATIETGRAFIGADLFYEDLRAQRLAHAVPDIICPLPGVTDQSVALEIDWPIWQAGQHFHYLEADGSIREGEVITFDTDAETIECSTWPLHDFHGYVNSEGSRQLQVITRTQIEDAERREEEQELALKTEAALAQLSKEQDRLPLFADQLTFLT